MPSEPAILSVPDPVNYPPAKVGCWAHFKPTQAALQYVRQRRALIEMGENSDGPAGETIRDQMGELWDGLTHEDHIWMRGYFFKEFQIKQESKSCEPSTR